MGPQNARDSTGRCAGDLQKTPHPGRAHFYPFHFCRIEMNNPIIPNVGQGRAPSEEGQA